MERTGKYAWAALVAGIAAYDLISEDSLTASFRRGAENPRTSPFVYGALGMTAAHLCGILPRHLDPFYLLIDKTPLGNLGMES